MINKKASEKNYQIFKKNIFLNTQERICNQILAKWVMKSSPLANLSI